MFDLIPLIKTVGYLGVFGIIFAESGLFVGFFLPGDSLIFTAGFLASQGFLNFYILAVGTFTAAVIGDSVGYAFGRKVGPAIFTKDDSIFFNKDHLTRSKAFYEKHGGKTIILARFIVFVRTFAPILAGVGQMRYSVFLTYNVIGGLLWAVGLSASGYFLGAIIPNVDHYILPIILSIVVVSVLPGLVYILKNKDMRQRITAIIFRKK